MKIKNELCYRGKILVIRPFSNEFGEMGVLFLNFYLIYYFMKEICDVVIMSFSNVSFTIGSKQHGITV